MVGSPTQKAERDREVLPEGWEGSEDLQQGLEGLGGWERLGVPQVGRDKREAFLESREESGGPEEFGSPSQRARRGRESLLEGQERLGGSPRGLGGVRRLSRRAGGGWGSLPDGPEGSGGPPGGSGGLGGPSRELGGVGRGGKG